MKTGDVKKETSGNWMLPEAATVQSNDTLEEAIDRMEHLGIHHLLVMRDKAFVGMLDARDCAGVATQGRRVQDLMTKDCPVIDEGTDVQRALNLMLERRLTALPIKSERGVCGIVTNTDLLRLFAKYEKDRHKFSGLITSGESLLAEPLTQSFVKFLGDSGI